VHHSTEKPICRCICEKLTAHTTPITSTRGKENADCIRDCSFYVDQGPNKPLFMWDSQSAIPPRVFFVSVHWRSVEMQLPDLFVSCSAGHARQRKFLERLRSRGTSASKSSKKKLRSFLGGVVMHNTQSWAVGLPGWVRAARIFGAVVSVWLYSKHVRPLNGSIWHLCAKSVWKRRSLCAVLVQIPPRQQQQRARLWGDTLSTFSQTARQIVIEFYYARCATPLSLSSKHRPGTKDAAKWRTMEWEQRSSEPPVTIRFSKCGFTGKVSFWEHCRAGFTSSLCLLPQ
jgi:hypothetical protein